MILELLSVRLRRSLWNLPSLPHSYTTYNHRPLPLSASRQTRTTLSRRSSLLKPASHSLPVDHVPDGLEVLGLAVLVLEVVGVLPGVDAHERDIRPRDRVLVGPRRDGQRAVRLVLDQPRPPGPLDAGQRRVHLLDERLVRAEVLGDGFLFTRKGIGLVRGIM